MSKTTSQNTRAVGGNTSVANNETPMPKSSPSPSLTFETVMHDVVSWWCYAILKQGDLKLFNELDDILDSLPGPFPASSPLSIRLRCLVPWHELLKQLYTPGCSVGEKRFETIQDKLLLLHQGFFSKTSAIEEFNEVLRMIQTHSVLSKLYHYFSKIDSTMHNEQEKNVTNKVLDQSNADWESIYLESDGVPPSLLDLVDKNNGWDHEDRRDHILQIVSFPDSTLTYKRLKKKMQSLLLAWFENEIFDSDQAKVPELLRKRYRDIGYGEQENVPKDTTGKTETIRNTPAFSKVHSRRLRDETSLVATSTPQQQAEVMEEQQQPEKEQESKSRRKRKSSPKHQHQHRLSKNQQKCDSLDQERESLVYESSDCGDWSDFDPEEELRRLKLHRERQKRFRNFSREMQTSTGQRMEELISMPVGEPSYSESTPQRKLTGGRKRRRLHDKYYRRDLPTTMSKAITGVKKGGFWDMSECSSSSCSSSSSDFDDSDDEVTPWTPEEDEALKNSIKWNGYGNWKMILEQEKRLLGSKNQEDLRNRANLLLLAHR